MFKVMKLANGKPFITFFARRTSKRHKFPYGLPAVNERGHCEYKAIFADGYVVVWVVMGYENGKANYAYLTKTKADGVSEDDFAAIYELAVGMV